MKKLLLLGIAGIFILTACSKAEDDDIVGPCDTEFYEPEWVASLSETSLEGDWKLEEISYIKLKDACVETDETAHPGNDVTFLSGNKGFIDQEESFSWNLDPYTQYRRWIRFGNFSGIFPENMNVGFEKDGEILAQVYDAFMDSDAEKVLVLEVKATGESGLYETARLRFSKNE